MNDDTLVKRVLCAISLAALLAGCGGGGASAPISPIGANTTQTAARSAVDVAAQQTQQAADERECARRQRSKDCILHVLLISVDGMHGVDLQRFVASHAGSVLAGLSKDGVTYTNAHTTGPSDSFPGLLALVTGGHPASTGVYYENSFDRTLFPPGSNCEGPVGSTVHMDESIDINPNAIDGGGGIDPGKLTEQLANGSCTHVFPHDYLRVNTLFELVKANGGRTAWSDKEQSYEMLNGPSGKGVDDFFNREIAAGGTTGSLTATESYDDTKVAAILNEIDGKSARGVAGVGVPALFGMNFQAVSVGQKLAVDPTTGLPGGYTDASGTPGTLLRGAIEHTDASIGKFVAELEKQGLDRSTLIVISSKHGQAPIDRTLRRGISDAPISAALAGNLGNGFIQTDDLALIWLQDRSAANEASALANLRPLAVEEGFDAGALFTRNNPPPNWGPFEDPRVPDFTIKVNLGVIYTTGPKVAEHGGFSDDDSHVALLLSHPGQPPHVVGRRVETVQVAPTILKALHIDGHRLQAVQREGTPDLGEVNLPN